ncbi:MAG: methyl-accepting chemotaxis protein [Spirochaetia bacterium]
MSNRYFSIRLKIIAGFVITILLIVFLGAFSVFTLINIQTGTVPTLLENTNLATGILEMRKNENALLTWETVHPGFYESRQSPYLDALNEVYETLLLNLEVLREYEADHGHTEDVQKVERIQFLVSEYHRLFTETVDLLLKKGFKDYGLVGLLRQAVHDVENELDRHEGIDRLKVIMLMNRRHEKDYLLRKDLSYRTKLNNRVDEFKAALTVSDLPREIKERLAEYITAYRERFNAMVEADIEIGLSREDGLIGEYYRALEEVEPLIQEERIAIETEINHTVERQVLILLIIAGSTAAAAAVFAFLIIRSVSSPLRRTITRLEDISEGEGDLSTELDIHTKDEMGKLAEYFNRFVANIRGILQNVLTASDSLTRSKQSLSANTEETAASIEQIEKNTQGMTNKMGMLSGKIDSSLDIVKSINGRVENLDIRIEDQTSAVEESSAAVNEMIASLNNVAGIIKNRRETADQLVNATQVGDRKLSSTAETIKQINANIGSVSEMIEIINEIADRTNLLSMNAAIEAAHAGESGKGFAVVADEIRTLAENSSKNATEIARVLTDVLDKIKSAFTSSTESTEAFQQIQKNVQAVSQVLDEISASTQELTSGSEEIMKAMSLLSDVSLDVREASKDMREQSSELNSSMETVDSVSKDVLNGIHEINAGTTEIAKAISQVTDLTAELSTQADALSREVRQFKLG